MISTASILLPSSFVIRNQEQLTQVRIADAIKEGDSVQIEFGYNDKNRSEFSGYIKRINLIDPIEIICEDVLYLFRKINYKTSFRKISLTDLLQYLIKGLNEKYGDVLSIDPNIPEFNFTNFIIKDGTGIDVLQEFKDKYGLSCFIHSIGGRDVLYCGLAYSIEKGIVKYVLERNTVNTSDLKFETSGEKKYRVRIVNFDKKGFKTEFEFGDKAGELRTIHFYGNNDLKTLRQKAAIEMEKFKTEGYSGSFETFLWPLCEPGSLADFSNLQFPARNGKYFITGVTTTIDSSGGRRKNDIGIRVQ
jgi:hypothetical protein